MVIEVSYGGVTAYMHSAFASDAVGTDFSLTPFDGAVYSGSYTSASATESTDYKKYTWTVIDDVVIDADDVDEGIDPDVYALQSSVETLQTKTNINTSDIIQLQEAVWTQ